MEQELTGIRYQSKVYPKVQTIMHRVNEETLMMEHIKQNPKKATGVDGVTKSEYDRNAEGNIADLVQRMKKFSYKPLPVRRTYIPKGNGKQRPLGIPSYEDKLVQGVMAGLLNEGTERRESDKGTPQGGLISPVLANVYLHYVLDVWFEDKMRKSLKGEAHYVRYADDFLMMFQYEEDAVQVMEALKERLGKFSLEVAEEKTRILPFGRTGGTAKDDFDFLGFTFYNTKTRKGNYRVGVRTSKKKMTAKKKAVKEWLRKQFAMPISWTLEKLNAKLRGHYGYYGVNGNYRSLYNFYQYAFYTTYRMLRRRSQRAGKLKIGNVAAVRICQKTAMKG